jgi:hypothetical protein
MDLNRLRRLANEVDDEHRDAMATITDDLVAAIVDVTPAVAANRRAFLRGGAVVTAGAVTLAVGPLVTSASAADATTTSAKATTTTAPPRQASDDDAKLLGFAQSIELAVVKVYQAAIDSSRLSSAVAGIATLFQSHHLAHANAVASLAGRFAPGRANAALLVKVNPKLSTTNTEADWLKVAFDLETAAAATYTFALGAIAGTDPAALVASIQPIEARHAMVFGDALGVPINQLVPSFEPSDAKGGALSPTDYALEG